MSSLLHEIKHQPLWVRQTLFGLSVVVSLSLVGGIWFSSFERDMFALLNPDPDVQEQHFAQFKSDSGPYALAVKALDGLRATISDFFGFDAQRSDTGAKSGSGQSHTLPLSE